MFLTQLKATVCKTSRFDGPSEWLRQDRFLEFYLFFLQLDVVWCQKNVLRSSRNRTISNHIVRMFTYIWMEKQPRSTSFYVWRTSRYLSYLCVCRTCVHVSLSIIFQHPQLHISREPEPDRNNKLFGVLWFFLPKRIFQSGIIQCKLNFYFKIAKLFSKPFEGNLRHQIIRGLRKWPSSIDIFILIDLNSWQNLVIQNPWNMLCQSIGIGSEDTFVTLCFSESDIFHFHVQSHLKQCVLKCKFLGVNGKCYKTLPWHYLQVWGSQLFPRDWRRWSCL